MIRLLPLIGLFALGILGCERQHPAQERSASVATQTAASAPKPSNERWKAGVHYETLATIQPTSTAGHGKSEVMEFFWYGCSHCYTLEPHLVLWSRKEADDVELVRVPIVWPSTRAHARLFYTLQVLGREDLHERVFDAVHRRGNRLSVPNDEDKTLKLQLEFAEAHGVTSAEFKKAYESLAVKSKLGRAELLARRYRIDGVPTIVVNDLYKTGLANTNGHEGDLILLVNDLSTSEHGR